MILLQKDMKRKIEKIRNIGFIAHIDAGKTTTTERVLFYSGRTHRLGEVDEGTTITDWMPQEKERGITITSASTYCMWRDYQINIIDTPGHVDFTAEVERSLKVLDGAIVILCAEGGVEPQSETVWRQANRYNVSRLVFINKMDKIGADFMGVVEQMRKKLAANPLVMQLPIYKDEDFVGIIDLLKEKAVFYHDDLGKKIVFEEIPPEYKEEAKKYRNILIEKLAEYDDTIIERFVNNQPLPEAKLIDSIRKQVIQNNLVPVFCGSSLKNRGIQLLLDAICRYLPSPLDIGEVEGFSAQEEVIRRKIDVDSPFCALCFKVMVDPYVGRLNYTRIYSGRIRAGEEIYNSTKEETERVSKIVCMHANRQEIIKEAVCGDIVCLVGLKSTTTGDTLCLKGDDIILERMHFPEPVISQAIEPHSKKDQEKLSYGLSKLAEEDPTFKVSYNKETGQTLVSGMGKLHLEVAIDRLIREFKVEAKIGRPQVAYRETITKRVTSRGKFIQQTGGHGQYGDVVFMLQPMEEDGIKFESKIKGGAIPKEFIPAIKEGVMEASKNGPLGGFPVTKVEVTLIDGSFHEVDSSELSFNMAAAMAFSDGVRRAFPVLLEPVMKLEVIVPEEYFSQVLADLHAKKANILSIEPKDNVRLIKANIALREVFDYANILRNITQGRGTYVMEPAFYDKVADEIAHKILEI